MKHLIMINGTMGVGKTTTSKQLAKLLQPCVFLDGDWCWDMHPFVVNDETKHMVMDNIVYLLNQYLNCSEFDYVIFCWVMHEQAILDEIISRLEVTDVQISCYSLLCNQEVLRKRLMKDVEIGRRSMELIERTIARLPLYEHQNTIKIDVSDCNSEEAAKRIIEDVRTRYSVL